MSPGCSTVAVKRLGTMARIFLPCQISLIGKRICEWTRGDSNPWPPPCEGGALPTELRALVSRRL